MGAVLKRINACFANYYDPDFDTETKLGLREDFMRALSNIPEWAIHRAFDTWVSTKTYRPPIAAIVELAKEEIAPFIREAKRRTAVAQPVEEPRVIVDMETRRRLMQEVFGADRATNSVGVAKKMPRAASEEEMEANRAAAKRAAEAEQRAAP